MKTMKLWRIAFMMLAAFSLASCSSDDDYKFDASKLEGKWRKAILSPSPLAAAMMTISLMQANLKESGEKPYEVALWMERR